MWMRVPPRGRKMAAEEPPPASWITTVLRP
jgi:hypothetical protein